MDIPAWIGHRRILIVLTIALLIYAAVVSAFFVYEAKEDQRHTTQRQTIAKCLDSGGHIGRGDTCWHVSPDENNELVP